MSRVSKRFRPFAPVLVALCILALSACDGGETVTIQPVGNEMRYAQTEFTVGVGEEVTVVFENVATSAAMEHNVVVLASDSDADADRVGIAALSAADQDYVPDDPAILAATAMSAPGETVQVTFTAPTEPGRYRYICTYPGHYALMQGVMIVT
ncbi:MAG: plastocyanin/azurin family copper-binding protein [Bacteroidota bacterium]